MWPKNRNGQSDGSAIYNGLWTSGVFSGESGGVDFHCVFDQACAVVLILILLVPCMRAQDFMRPAEGFVACSCLPQLSALSIPSISQLTIPSLSSLACAEVSFVKPCISSDMLLKCVKLVASLTSFRCRSDPVVDGSGSGRHPLHVQLATTVRIHLADEEGHANFFQPLQGILKWTSPLTSPTAPTHAGIRR